MKTRVLRQQFKCSVFEIQFPYFLSGWRELGSPSKTRYHLVLIFCPLDTKKCSRYHPNALAISRVSILISELELIYFYFPSFQVRQIRICRHKGFWNSRDRATHSWFFGVCMIRGSHVIPKWVVNTFGGEARKDFWVYVVAGGEVVRPPQFPEKDGTGTPRLDFITW